MQTVGLSLLSYSSPTDDAESTGSVMVEAHYYTIIPTVINVGGAITGSIILLFLITTVVSEFSYVVVMYD